MGSTDELKELPATLSSSGPAGEVQSGDPSVTTDGRDLVQMLETSITPLRLPAQMQLLRRQIDRYEPDVVHALRVPYEGLIALQASSQTPVALSCWGQDFSRQAGRDPLLARWVKRSLPRAAGLHVDAKVDLQRAREYGWSADRPTLHAAGNFGVRSDRVFEIERSGPLKIVYPRGRRQYIRHELFLGMITAFASDPRFEFHGPVETAGIAQVRLIQPKSRFWSALASKPTAVGRSPRRCTPRP